MTDEEHRAIDREVAEKVMGQQWNGGHPMEAYDGKWPWPAPYSTNMDATWSMVEFICVRDHLELEVRWCDGYAVAEFSIETNRGFKAVPGALAEEDEMPLAICRAALAVVAKRKNVGEEEVGKQTLPP